MYFLLMLYASRKERSKKLHSFIIKLQELNTYLGEFTPGTPRQETAPHPINEIMDIIYYSMPTMWKKMIEGSIMQILHQRNISFL